MPRTVVCEFSLSCSLQGFFETFFASSDFGRHFHTSRGDANVTVGPWIDDIDPRPNTDAAAAAPGDSSASPGWKHRYVTFAPRISVPSVLRKVISVDGLSCVVSERILYHTSRIEVTTAVEFEQEAMKSFQTSTSWVITASEQSEGPEQSLISIEGTSRYVGGAWGVTGIVESKMAADIEAGFILWRDLARKWLQERIAPLSAVKTLLSPLQAAADQQPLPAARSAVSPAAWSTSDGEEQYLDAASIVDDASEENEELAVASATNAQANVVTDVGSTDARTAQLIEALERKVLELRCQLEPTEYRLSMVEKEVIQLKAVVSSQNDREHWTWFLLALVGSFSLISNLRRVFP